MSPARLFSSEQIEAALERAGFTLARKSAGSHQAYAKELADGRHLVVIVPHGKHEVPKGTLRSILKQACLTEDEFAALAGIKQKGRSKQRPAGPESGPEN